MNYDELGGVHPHPTVGKQPGKIGDEYAEIRPDISKKITSKICPTCGQPVKGGQKPLQFKPTHGGWSDEQQALAGSGKPGDPTLPRPPYTFPGFPSKPGQPEGGARTAVVVPNKCGPGWHHPSDPDTSCGGKGTLPEYQTPKRPGISKPTYPLPYPKKYRR